MIVVWVAVSLTFMAVSPAVIDNATMNTLFDQEAKLFTPQQIG